jgi:hypothetical protein
MEQAISLNSRALLKTSQFIAILALIVFAPLIGNQFVTGTVVNASLLLSVALFGFSGAAALSFFPSMVSLFSGLLPWSMAPMVPFIIAGNILLVLVFDLLRRRNFFLGLVPGALLKFSFLFLTSNYLIHFFIKSAVASNVAAMMSWPQLVTALLGGIVVYSLMAGYNFLKDNK